MLVNSNELDLMADFHTETNLREGCVPVGQQLLHTISFDSHIESKTSWFIASHDAYSTLVIAYMTAACSLDGQTQSSLLQGCVRFCRSKLENHSCCPKKFFYIKK